MTEWSHIQAHLRPDAAQGLIDGSLWDRRCPYCGYEFTVYYDLLYHDPEHTTYVWLNHRGTYDEPGAQFLSSMTSVLGQSDYELRVVRSAAELAEKVYIASLGLSDIKVELFKLMLCIQHGIPITSALYFDGIQKRLLRGSEIRVICPSRDGATAVYTKSLKDLDMHSDRILSRFSIPTVCGRWKEVNREILLSAMETAGIMHKVGEDEL